ncbi:MAG TPA: hypothetical protein VFZ34_31760 [Blastocatellia bacterium]|nr:hypothetical protein [Blastocatellia bacterium]
MSKQDVHQSSAAVAAKVLEEADRHRSDKSLKREACGKLRQCLNTDLERTTPEERKSWLEQVYTNLRLLRLAETGEVTTLPSTSHVLGVRQAAEIEVLDVLAEQTDWTRLGVLVNSTYEMFIYRLRAMAILDITFASSTDEYVTRFCTEYRRLNVVTATAERQSHSLLLLLSIQDVLKARFIDDPAENESPSEENLPAPAVQRDTPQQAWRIALGTKYDLLLRRALVWVRATWQRRRHHNASQRSLPPFSQAALPAAPSVPPAHVGTAKPVGLAMHD